MAAAVHHALKAGIVWGEPLWHHRHCDAVADIGLVLDPFTKMKSIDVKL
jgi:hypothetical protein